MIAVGLICGTSLDGIDAARVEVRPRAHGYDVATAAFVTVPFEPELRARVLAAYPPQPLDALAFSALHADVGTAFGAAALAAGGGSVDFVASHGLTLAHAGERAHTLQIGDAFRIRETTEATVVYDFRSADTAAGGHGAPLVPYVDALLLAAPNEERVALNLGGIANLTVLPANATPADAIAFDSGPANLPIDTYVAARTAGRVQCDRDGALARGGSPDAALLAHMLADPYFAAPAPKSTGRERFGAAFIDVHRAALDALSCNDAVATLTALTVGTVAGAIRAAAPAAVRVIASGGGVHNPAILDGLRAALPRMRVERSDAYGIDPDAKEAIAFAILAYQTWRRRPSNLPSATGARHPVVLGKITF
jgi:anhydro-N-acetylmuramic acid kinase